MRIGVCYVQLSRRDEKWVVEVDKKARFKEALKPTKNLLNQSVSLCISVCFQLSASVSMCIGVCDSTLNFQEG